MVAVLGLECDGDKYDWKRGKSKRRRSGVRTEIGDNFSLFFWRSFPETRLDCVVEDVSYVELRFKIFGAAFVCICLASNALNTTQAGHRKGPDCKTVDYWRHGHGS